MTVPLPACTCQPGTLSHSCARHGLREATNQARPRKGLRAQSDKHALDAARWAGVKDGMLHMARKLDPDGPRCDSCGVAGNSKTLDLDHVHPRGKGGRSVAANAAILCRDCHQAKHGVPMWSTNE